MKAMTIKQLYAILFMFAAFTAFGQQAQVKTSIDSTKIRIGSQAKLTLKATVDTASKVNFPEGKNFGQLEVLESYPIDTIRKGAIYELVKKYGLTQFDSGRFVIPRLPVVINNKTFQTDSIALEVNNIKVDTLKQKMFDIKPLANTKSNYDVWIYFILTLLVLGGIGYGIWWYIKKRNQQPVNIRPKVVITPIERATSELQNLEKKELLQRGAVKEYYSELSDIARTYIEEAIHIPAKESTTSELIEAMRNAVLRKKMLLKQETFEQLEEVLRAADLVKFAKSRPLDFEIAQDRTRIENTIVVIDKSIPEEKPEDEDHTQRWIEEQRKKKEKHRRTIIIISSAAAVLLLLVGVSVFYVKDKLFGTPTKELLEGQWIKSEYGNPGITVETPKVLKRLNVAGMVPKDAAALIRDMNLFGYGAMFDDFYVEVSTISYNQQTEIDLNATTEEVIKVWESRGASNIIIKSEDFNTDKGITGLRSYGNMTLPNPLTKKPVRSYYELFFFKQQGGLQQVLVIHREGDPYGMQILDRIKKSIELRSLNQ
jgi:flagellar basal body-associated protein FliL